MKHCWGFANAARGIAAGALFSLSASVSAQDTIGSLPVIVVTDTTVSYGSTISYTPTNPFNYGPIGGSGPVMTPDKINMVQIQTNACWTTSYGPSVKQSRHSDEQSVRAAVVSSMVAQVISRNIMTTQFGMYKKVQTSQGLRNTVKVYHADGWAETWILLPNYATAGSIKVYPEPMPESRMPALSGCLG